MKTTEAKKLKKSKNKTKAVSKQKVHRVAQELKFARVLAGNEKKSRDRILKTMKKWIVNCFDKGYEFKEEDFIRMWKGLFYAMWMSDKPLVQEELCENISATLDLFPKEQFHNALLMMKAGLRVLATEWFGLDQHRMDKFLMLVRRLLRASLRAVARCEWALDACTKYTHMLTEEDGIFARKTPLYARNAISLQIHVCECFIEELCKVSKGSIPEASLVQLLSAFATYMSHGPELRVAVACRRIFTQLVRQSDAGIQYQEEKLTRNNTEDPGSDDGDDDAESGDEQSDQDHDDDGPLDPRAGRVDVVLTPLPVPASLLAAMLKEQMKDATNAARTRVKICMQRFEQLASDVYPFVEAPPPDLADPALRIPRAGKAAKKLSNLERRLVVDSDQLALRGLSRKHRKRLLAKSRAGLSIVEELHSITNNTHSENSNTTNGNWQVEDAEPQSKIYKSEDSSNKENLNSKKKSKKRKHLEQADVTSPKKQKDDEKFVIKEKKSKNKVKKDKVKITIKDKSDKPTKIAVTTTEKSSKKDKKVKVVLTVSPKKEAMKNKLDKQQGQKKDDSSKNKEMRKQTVDVKKLPLLLVNKLRNFQKQTSPSKSDKKAEKKHNKKQTKSDEKTSEKKVIYSTPKKVKFVIKNNSMQDPLDYYKSVRQSPNIPYDSSKKPTKTNLKPNSTPSPINPFFKKKLRLRK